MIPEEGVEQVRLRIGADVVPRRLATAPTIGDLRPGQHAEAPADMVAEEAP